MEANRGRTRWTWEEYARLPTSGSTRYEVIADEVAVTPSPSSRHQRIVGVLFNRLFSFVEENALGEVFVGPFDVLLGEGDYLEPDLLYVRSDHMELVTDRGVEGAPDLVVEIASPSTASRDRGIKLERYRHFGVPEYWVVDPDARRVEVWRLAEGVAEPVVLEAADVLEWRPASRGPALVLPLTDVLGET